MAASILLRRIVSPAMADAWPPPNPDWLTGEEAARLSTMRSPQRRSQFLAGHWLARELAARFAGGDPALWAWHREEGAPSMLTRDGERVFASISHSGDDIACAVAADPMGVDIETSVKPRDLLEIAGQAFSPDECAQLQALTAQALHERFLVFWTIKEACGKRTGTGLHLEASRRERPVRLAADSSSGIRTWQFPGTTIALAAASGTDVVVEGIPENARHEYWRIEPVV